ncbi:MAG: hypothetical protein ACJAYU_001747 [Bradymonadia bacterium]|jgi:uncharacterized protein YjbI with pentapeptide repeats
MTQVLLCNNKLYSDEEFDTALLSDRKLHGAEFVGCTFRSCSFSGSTLTDVGFEDCEFHLCDLSSLRLESTSFSGVAFHDSKLLGIDWSDAALAFDATFKGCTLDYASFSGMGLNGVSFTECRLLEVDFTGADARGVQFHECELQRSSFDRAKLKKADFSTSTGVFIDPGTADARGAIIGPETAVELARRSGLVVKGFD